MAPAGRIAEHLEEARRHASSYVAHMGDVFAHLGKDDGKVLSSGLGLKNGG